MIGLRTLLDGILDYAGLFPPARLPLEESIQNYARYRQSKYPWMLNRFLCPTVSLEPLQPCIQELFTKKSCCPISTIARGGETHTQCLTNLQADLDDISTFHAQCAERAKVEMLELRLPHESLSSSKLSEILALIHNSSTPLFPFIEVSSDADFREVIQSLRGQQVGFKLRCGGLDASAFPSAHTVAATLIHCRDAQVPLKFTAGLHHPVRHVDEELQVKMHGFFNVFIGGVLAHAHKLSEEVLLSIIEEEDTKQFQFDETGLSWRIHRANLSQIQEARQRVVLSYGSCSFDEPIEDLISLGLLEHP